MCLFGDVRDGMICLSRAGAAVWSVWETLPLRFPSVELDAFIVMPNHVHLVLWLASAPAGDREPGRASPAPTLGDVVGTFKSLCARAVRLAGGRPGSLWQRNYYERIIRDERELHDVRRYVLDNPVTWELDDEHPDRALASEDLP